MTTYPPKEIIMPERIELTVLINLDQAPGVFHTPESARQVVEGTLLTRLGHYEPVVLIADK